jgi:hypothetical protein
MTGREAQAYFLEGNELVKWMRGYDSMQTGACTENECVANAFMFLGYVIGVHDATSFSYSKPAGIIRGQVVVVVSKFLKEHPERWSEPAFVLVIDALKETFPRQ